MKRYNVELFVIVPTACLHVPEVEDALKAITVRAGGVTITETVRRAINLLSIVDQALDEGARVQLVTETAHGRETETLRFL